MFHELNRALRALLKERAPAESLLRLGSSGLGGAAGVPVVFDMPTREWADAVDDLVLNCYLYDIREETGLATPEAASDARGRPCRVVLMGCAYCLSAWAKPGADPEHPSVFFEHQLLAEALGVLLAHPRLPEALLPEALRAGPAPMPWLIARSEGVGRDPEFWSALGQPPKPSLNLVYALPFLVPLDAPQGAPVERLHVGVTPVTGPADQAPRGGGP